MKILVLEDDVYRTRYFIERYGEHDMVITENAYQAIEYLKEDTYDYIFLDNDLGDNNGSGEDVAQFLFYNQENPNNKAVIIVHSWNVVASRHITDRLSGAIPAPFNTERFFNLALDI
jgi:DNA-binding response OmpR family regulator